jgi:DNA-binding NarL/FixJ family response regulator
MTPATGPLTVIVVDDHTFVRRGILGFLETLPDIVAVGEAADGAQALERLARLQRESGHLPDVALVDIKMPGLDGPQLIAQLRTRFPSVRALILTGYTEIEYAHAALSAGAAGYVLKDATPDQVAQAIRHAARGEVYLDPSVAGGLTSRLITPAGLGALTGQERKVLSLVAHGLSNREIGDQLRISERTVRSHMTGVLAKLGLASRTQAALLAVREGLVQLDERLPGRLIVGNEGRVTGAPREREIPRAAARTAGMKLRAVLRRDGMMIDSAATTMLSGPRMGAATEVDSGSICLSVIAYPLVRMTDSWRRSSAGSTVVCSVYLGSGPASTWLTASAPAWASRTRPTAVT